MNKIKVITKQPGEMPHSVWMSPELENLQGYVGGYIEMFSVSADCVIICNEEGKILGYPYNFTLQGEDFVGPVIFAGVNGEELCDIPAAFSEFRRLFPRLFKVERAQI